MPASGVVGIADHCGWAILVTASRDGKLLDRRRVELVGEDLPKLPHHHECQTLPLERAEELVERVRGSANRHAGMALDAVAAAVEGPIIGVAIRRCPTLPPTTAGRIQNYYAQTRADGVMYREALAGAAEERGWGVHWYDSRRVLNLASGPLGVENLEAHFAKVRAVFGPPWGQDHRIAMAAAIAAMHGLPA